MQVDLAEARERARPDGGRGAALERLGVQGLGDLELVEPEGDSASSNWSASDARLEPVAK